MKRLFALRYNFLLLGVFSLVSLFALSMLNAPVAYAAECGGLQTSVIDCGSANDQTGSPVVAFLVIGIQILTGAIGVVAIGAFVYAGMMYASASGDAGQVTKAKEIIRNTVIGLILFATIALILNYLIPGGLFDGSAKFGAGGNGLGSVKASKLAPQMRTTEDDDTTDNTTNDTNNNPDSTLKMMVGSWNVYKFGSTKNSVSGVKTLMKEKGVDILGMQETQADVPAIKKGLGDNYGIYPTSKKDPRKVAIAWNKSKFSVVSKGNFVGAYQPSEGRPREFVWIKFKSKNSGKVFYVINTHFPQHGYYKKGDKWYISSSSSNGKAYAKHMSILTDKLKSKFMKDNVPIFLTGDYNFNARRDSCTKNTPCKELGRDLSVKSGWAHTNFSDVPSSQGTIDSSAAIIDYVFSWDKSYVTYQSMRILTSAKGGWSGSDHKPVGLTVTIGVQK